MNKFTQRKCRRGAILPMFAFLCPVLFILCGFAINVAYMQLVSTELKVATDVAAHAGGRAMSIHQDTQKAWDFAVQAGALNNVAGAPLQITQDENHLKFGRSARSNNGFGRYEFIPVDRASIEDGSERATSIAVMGRLNLPLIFTAMPGTSTVQASRVSVATQVDRDIALVLDRSGSMLYYKDDDALEDAIYEIYNTHEDVTYRHRHDHDEPYHDHTESRRLISKDERDNALRSLYSRRYSSNLRGHLHNWDSSFGEYTDDWMNKKSYSSSYSTGAPRHSRWALLALGVERFLDVLDLTDQHELVSLTTFSSGASQDIDLQSTYDTIRTAVENIKPYGGTAIGSGMQVGLPPIINGSLARPFAAKTIVVLTDGDNNNGSDPETVVQNIRNSNNVTIHTVTFTEGAVQGPMEAVALAGGGRHYHAEDGNVLIDIFEEIANNLPTILTQ